MMMNQVIGIVMTVVGGYVLKRQKVINVGIEDDIKLLVNREDADATRIINFLVRIEDKLDKILGKGFVFNKELKVDKAESLNEVPKDYDKLPLSWERTQATLLSVTYCEDMERLKRSHPQFIRYDTIFRNKKGEYPINFKEGLILVFIHINTGLPFTTIRRYTEKKADYYESKKWHTFELLRIC